MTDPDPRCAYVHDTGAICGLTETDGNHYLGGHPFAPPTPDPRSAGLTAGSHPGEPHVFRMTCERCGEPGYVNLSIVGPDEWVTIEPVEVKS